jgi:predicted dehydrogenase
MTEIERVRVGLVGLGGVCEAVHQPGFSRIPGVEIAAICDADPDLLQKRSRSWHIPQAFSDFEQLLAESKVDAVAIATPNARHCALVHQALSAECHVICEKPLGMHFAEALEMYQAAEESSKRHMVAFTYRRVPGMRYLKQLIQDGTLGVVRHARFQRLQDWGEASIGWRQYKDQAGYGELGDMGIHRIDFSEDLLGPIAAVCAAKKASY